MRIAKRLLCVASLMLEICFIVPLLVSCGSAQKPTFTSASESVISEEQIVQFSNESNDQYNKLTAYWGDKLPSYYGGAYIGNQEFIILVTCDPGSVEDEIWKVTGNNRIIIKQVKYSYEYLVSVKDEIVSKISKLSGDGNEKAKQLIGFGVDEKNNKIFVEYLDDGKVAINKSDIYDMTGYRDLVDIVSKKEPYTASVTKGS